MDDQMRYPQREQTNLDEACEAQYADLQVKELYQNGLISRAEADVYDILAGLLDDGQNGTLCRI